MCDAQNGRITKLPVRRRTWGAVIPVGGFVMRCNFRSLACASGVLFVVLAGGVVARGNSGIQLPMNQYAPGSESATLVTNGNFESGATGWTSSGNIITAAPIYSNTSNNGLLSAQMNDNASPASYSQNAPA